MVTLFTPMRYLLAMKDNDKKKSVQKKYCVWSCLKFIDFVWERTYNQNTRETVQRDSLTNWILVAHIDIT